MTFCSDPRTVVARKRHTCTWCGRGIWPGDAYHTWGSVDGSWFTNKMHTACKGVMDDEFHKYGDPEYTPYENEPPEIVI